jgi:hypothetical protein
VRRREPPCERERIDPVKEIVAYFPGSSVGLSGREVGFLESLAKHVAEGGNPIAWMKEHVTRERVDLVPTPSQGVVATCPTCGLVLESEGVECAACWGGVR